MSKILTAIVLSQAVACATNPAHPTRTAKPSADHQARVERMARQAELDYWVDMARGGRKRKPIFECRELNGRLYCEQE